MLRYPQTCSSYGTATQVTEPGMNIRETLSTGAPSSKRTSASDGSVNGSIPEPETEDKASRTCV